MYILFTFFYYKLKYATPRDHNLFFNLYRSGNCEVPYRLKRGTNFSEDVGVLGVRRRVDCEISYQLEIKRNC